MVRREGQIKEHQADNTTTPQGKLFSGDVAIEDAIERLRTRLLDLSARNPLLNYRHPKARCIQIVGNSSISLLFKSLYADGEKIPLKYIPEPPPDIYKEEKRPEARVYATHLGIPTSLEFEPKLKASKRQRSQEIQTLLYPIDLERQVRKISSEAKAAIEETGTNMLFMIFGFLEFYNSENSEIPMLAPLLSLPIVLDRDKRDQETGTHLYTVKHNGEDLTDNLTLREKCQRDFMLSFPEFGEQDEPEFYFTQIERLIRNKRRWKVRRQITLGMLSFGKLAIWSDLDAKKNPGFTQHSLIKLIFSGGANAGDNSSCKKDYAEDYRIDEHPKATQLIVCDADSSQHSAIIDVLDGKNIVNFRQICLKG